jgi:hypothetical protein
MLTMREYQCHKRVRAAEITEVHTVEADKSCRLSLKGSAEVFLTSEGFAARGLPQPGDYLVVYDQGYHAWSPKHVFEDGYTAVA